jgi:hypothetical protein
MRPGTVLGIIGMAVALAAVLALTVTCGGRPGSPEELYARVAELNAAGETGKIWDLLTDDAREREIQAIEDFRVTLKKNPGTEKMVRQWNCTKEEFQTLTYVELYRRGNLGNERAFLDAKITDKQTDPRQPGDEILTVVNSLGTTFYVRTRPVPGGWGLVQIIPRAAMSRPK